MRTSRAQLVVEIPDELRRRLKVAAAVAGISLRAMITPALDRLAKTSPPNTEHKQEHHS